jgi:hypothetical protein
MKVNRVVNSRAHSLSLEPRKIPSSSNPPITRNASVAIVSICAYPKEHGNLTELSTKNLKAYCEYHGYDCFLATSSLDTSRPTAWSKILLVLNFHTTKEEESIVDIQKIPFSSQAVDKVNILKGRKNADYEKLDTVNFKLEGGLFSSLYIDLIKDPSNIFSENVFEMYNFSFEDITQINDRQVFVISFKQKSSIEDPDLLYRGKLFIDAKSLAIISANFQLNVENRIKAGLIFTRKKPKGVVIYPTEVSYQVDYRQQNNKWIFSYSRGDITFKLNWNKWIFNTTYNTTFELVNTDWENQDSKAQINTQKLSPYVIMSDKIPNTEDVNFWGEYNIIEPEKSIESAIKKIQGKKLKEILID